MLNYSATESNEYIVEGSRWTDQHDQAHGHYDRSANRGAPKAAARHGMLSQAVAKALQPSFFFAMFEDDVHEFVPADNLRSRNSMQVIVSPSPALPCTKFRFPILRTRYVQLLQAGAQRHSMPHCNTLPGARLALPWLVCGALCKFNGYMMSPRKCVCLCAGIPHCQLHSGLGR